MSELYTTRLTTSSHTLSQFATRAKRLHAAGQQEDFIRFVLTGEYKNSEGHSRQAFLDPIQNRIGVDEHVTIARDYDSALGISDNVLVDGPISVYAVPHPSYSLKASIHVKHEIEYQNETYFVDFHHIPNFEFGFFGARHHLNIFFPELWSPQHGKTPQPWQLTEAQRTYWYQTGFRPAIKRLLGDRIASEWPVTYRAEQLRAHKKTGGYAWATKIIPKEAVGGLMQEVRELIASDIFTDDATSAWARNFFVLHTIRGVKHATYHPLDAQSAEFFLLELFDDAQLVARAPELGTWYIDVGIEVASSNSLCLQWMTSMHHSIVKQAMAGVDDAFAARSTRLGATGYYRDMASHLTAVSGFRLTPSPRMYSDYEVSYVQAYTTDKAVVYHREGGHHAKYLTTREALGTTQPSETIGGVHDIYESARGGVSSCARLEVRVPYRYSSFVLLELDASALRQSLSGFTREEWWNFRLLRVLAISKTLHIQAGGSTANRFLPESLTLTAGLVWLLNGLHARPDDLPSSRRLMDAILPVTEEEDANLDVLAYSGRPRGVDVDAEIELDARGIPYNPYGCVFFRRLTLQGVDVPRVRFGGPTLPQRAFQHWFNGMTREELQAKYQTSGIIDKNIIARTRSTSNKRIPPNYVDFANLEGPPRKIFHLAIRGYTLPPLDDDASDNEDRPSPPPEEPRDIDEYLTHLWKQFVVDVTSKSPNPTGITTPSYLKLSDVERFSGNEDIYQHLRLSEVFTAVYYRNASSSDWERSFGWFFPPLGHKTSTAVHNYCCVKYYKRWMALLERLKDDAVLVEVIRNQLKRRMFEWEWMPNAQQDRMWPTSPKSTRFSRWPATPALRLPAPHILLKANARPIFVEQDEDDDSSSTSDNSF